MFRILLVLLIVPISMFADVDKEMNKIFNKFNSSVNVSPGAIYDGQRAGYMTGGGVTVRNPVKTTHLANIQIPNAPSASCSGIDIYTGSLSYINKEQFQETMKAIASNSVGYAAMLAIETYSPQIANKLESSMNTIRKINEQGINSCEAAAALVGSVWPKKNEADVGSCIQYERTQGNASDQVEARQKCGEDSGREETKINQQASPGYMKQLGDEYNLTWEIIKRHSRLAGDTTEVGVATQELFMNLIGTVITRKEDGNSKVEHIRAMIESEADLDMFMVGGEVSLYMCDAGSDKCLFPAIINHNISKEEAWISRIEKMLLSMERKILEDEELDANEIDLLATSRIPLYKYINVLTAYYKGGTTVHLYNIARMVAKDLLLKYVQEVIADVRGGAEYMREGVEYDFSITTFKERLDSLEQTVRYYQLKLEKGHQEEFLLMQEVDMLESKIASEMILR